MIIIKARRAACLFSIAFLVLLLLEGSMATAASGAQGTAHVANIDIPENQQVQVTAPVNSNFSVLSVRGQGYSLQTMQLFNSNVLTFTPTNITQFHLVLNVSSTGSNFAYVTKQSPSISTPACNSCNFTGQGNLIVTININSTKDTASSPAWDPLFGMLPVKWPGFALSFDDVIIAMAAFGFFFLALGVLVHSKVTYLGLVILFIIGAIELGLLILLGLVGTYIVGFGIINLLWRYRAWRRRK